MAANERLNRKQKRTQKKDSLDDFCCIGVCQFLYSCTGNDFVLLQ